MKVLSGIDPCIIDSTNESLNHPFTPGEILASLKLMVPLKASSEDGLGVIFY